MMLDFSEIDAIQQIAMEDEDQRESFKNQRLKYCLSDADLEGMAAIKQWHWSGDHQMSKCRLTRMSFLG